MGRHKDPEILKLIENLKEKGKSSGFNAIDEFKLLNGVYYVDLVWTPYETKHRIFITFEIEKEDQRTLKNTDKIFDTPASAVEKPYQHFIIIYDSKLSEGDKIIVEEKARRYNIQVFENIKNNPEERNRFYEELEQLRIPINTLIEKRGIDDQIETINEAISGLGKITSVFVVDNSKFTINPSIMQEESKLEASQANEYKRHKYSKTALVAIPPIEYIFAVQGTKSSFEVYIDQIRNDKKYTYIVMEACNYPFKIVLDIKNPNDSTANLSIDPSEADVVQLQFFEQLRIDVLQAKAITVYYPDGRIKYKISTFRNPSNMASDNWFNLVTDLAFISATLQKRILAPKSLIISARDKVDIKRVKTLLMDGFVKISLKSFTFFANKDVINCLIEMQKREGALKNISIQNSNIEEKILEQTFAVGPAFMFFAGNWLLESPLEEVERTIANLTDKSLIQQTIMPATGKGLTIALFLNWYKKNEFIRPYP